MAIEFGKGIALAGGFDLGAKAPLDSRLTVATIEERDAHVTGNRAYDGMLVYVEADQITYQCVADADGNLTWKEFGFTETDFLVHIADNLTTEDADKVLSANQGVVLKGLIDAETEAREEADDALQENIDTLDAYIGDIPSGYTETNIVAYINKKAEETLNAATGDGGESAASVKAALDTYKADNDAKVAANTTAAANAQTAADAAQAHSEGVAADLAVEIKAREDADTAQIERIAALEGTIVGLSGAMHFEGVKDAIPEDVSGYEQGDVIIVGNKEYVFNNGAFVEFGDASVNAEAITALTERMDAAESEIGALQEADEAINVAIAEKVSQTDYDTKVEELVAADNEMAGRLDDIEAIVGKGDKTVANQIADAVAVEKSEREAAIALKADKTEVGAVSGKVTTLETDMAQAKEDIDNVEADVATKAEQADLEAETAAREALDARVVVVEGKAHTHTNADELAKITSGDVAKWNAISEDMTEYVDTEIDKIEGIIGGIPADKTIAKLFTEMHEECEANETAAIAAANDYTDGKIKAVNDTIGAVTEGKTVVGMIEEAKDAAAEAAAAAADATSKANAAENAAKGHADGLNSAMSARVDALEAIDHEHSNKAELDLIVTGDKNKWDEAAAKAHEHSNKTVLDGITAAKVTAWDAAEGNAKTYADGLNSAMDTRVEALETWHENFVEITEAEINSLFA